MTNLILPISERRIYSPYKFTMNFLEYSDNLLEFKGNLVVDTGSVRTSISAWDSIKDKSKLRDLKKREIERYLNGEVKCIVNHGLFKGENCINSSRELKILDKEDLLQVKNISFLHIVDNFELNGINFSDVELTISYDRKTFSLIGMSFLENYNSEIRQIEGNPYFILNTGININTSLYKKAINMLNAKIKIKEVKSELLKYSSNEEVDALLIEILGDEYVESF